MLKHSNFLLDKALFLLLSAKRFKYRLYRTSQDTSNPVNARNYLIVGGYREYIGPTYSINSQ